MANKADNPFVLRARLEAARYGTDPWVFVRELLQNARDAGARRISFDTSTVDGDERVACRDDGSGMSFEHAQRYLFSLYASSKRGRSGAAGRFGIGFWSVLRFEPTRIYVRSQPQRGGAWMVRLDGCLEESTREPTEMHRGTEIILQRPVSGDDLERCLEAAILRDAPFVNCRDPADRPLVVLVNGRPVRAEPTLPPPSLSFRCRGLRGVVGLGPEPRAEIFAHGLKVREAATLDELLVEAHPKPATLPGVSEGLAPMVIIDSSDLRVLMARGDAREDRALERLVAVGRRELSRLVRVELDRHTGLSAPARLIERLKETWSTSRVVKAAAAVLLVFLLAVLVRRGTSRWLPVRSSQPEMSRSGISIGPSPAIPFRDLWGRYRGPDVDSVGGSGELIDLSYRPAEGVRHFAALWVTGLDRAGRLDADDQRVTGPYEHPPCIDDCLEVELGIDASAGLLRLPIATGHALDPESVELDGARVPVVAIASGQPALQLQGKRAGRVHYRLRPGVFDGGAGESTWPPLPPAAAARAGELTALPISTRAVAAAEFVRRRVSYDTSADTIAKHRDARRRTIGLFARAAAIGAGDCDVQNSLVAAMLAEAGVRSRLAVGWVGFGGRARTGLHAWTEYRGEGGSWQVIDASVGGADVPAVTDAIPVTERQPDRPRSGVLAWWTAAGSALLVLAAVAFLLGRRSWRRSFRAGDESDVVGLLRGAAIRPQAFEEIQSLVTRRLLRLLGGRSVSLARAREAARRGRLACGSRRSQLARRAARGGGLVLDLDRAESAAVAEVLTAVDLDRWQALLEGSARNELTARVEDILRTCREPGRLVIADNPGYELEIMDGHGFGLGTIDRWAVADVNGALWRSARRLAARQPDRAALMLADAVLHRTGAPPSVRRRCLSKLALESLLEASREAP